VARLQDKVASDLSAFETLAGRVSTFTAQAPELESKINSLLAEFRVIDEGTQTAARTKELVSELDAQLTRVTARSQFVEHLEKRLNTLNEMTADVDHRMQDLLTRRADLESVEARCDSISALIVEAEHKLEAVTSSQAKLLPLTTDVKQLETQLAVALSRLKDLERDEAGLRDHERRLNEVADSNRILASQMADRLRQMQNLNQELSRASAVKDELLGELSTVRSQQQETLACITASADQLAGVETMMAQFEQRRAELALAERTMTGVEKRMNDLSQLGEHVQAQIEAVTDQQQLVAAVKAEVNGIHEIAVRSKTDLQHVADHRGELAALQETVDKLISLIAQTDDKVMLIEARKHLVDEVEAKSTMITNLLDDVRVNLEALGEQKALVAHVAETMAGADFAIQEARNTLRSLQQERERAERIEQSIKQLRARTESKRSAAR
jgi:chromosome segregation ATPase